MSKIVPRMGLLVGLVLTMLSHSVLAKQTVTVFAAASLTNALTRIGDQYNKDHDTKVLFSFASSSTLARQIEMGAPAQIFLSANQKWMNYLIDKQAVNVNSRKTLLTNKLVLIASDASHIDNISLNKGWNIDKTLGDNRLAVGDPDHVPAGKYAKQALINLGLWKAAEPRLASASNVRAALALVERGEAPLGIVYGTDASIAKGIKTVATFPENSHQAIEYPMAMVKLSPSKAVISFYDYLQSQQAKAVFEQYGFGVI